MSKSKPYLVPHTRSTRLYIRDGDKLVSTRETDRGRATAVLHRYISDKQAAVAAKVGVRLSDVLDVYEQERRTLNANTYEHKWRYLIARLRKRDGRRHLEEITPDWAKEFVRERLQEVQEPTIRQDLSSLTAAWALALRRGVTSLPVPPFDLPSASEPREDFLMRDEAERLVAAASKPHVRLFVRLALATAGRHKALLELRWSQVDLENGLVDLRRRAEPIPRKHRAGAKAPVPRQKARGHVPIAGTIIDELRISRERAVTDFVIEYRGKPLSSIKNGFSKAVIDAGLNPDFITPHALRHTAATWAMQAGVDPHKVAGMLGHKDTKMVMQVYGHHHPLFMHGISDALRLD
ncbi:Site-specific recombinase XerD [Loktanella salsilacus]|uniref:Site-specific recombinase XerD n=1 Tax=Loktanella salsilacus TaxID=195913 RepID=A0A1I4EUG4_9RHOB|nr:site-specific integrase [Loktanella salsilacus]SFL09352.1 Site-specific recombinase XerD [Loktanella salsilacus]